MEELFRTLVDQSNDALFIIDPNSGTFMDVNQKACSSLQYSREELMGLRVLDIEASMTDEKMWISHVEEIKGKKAIILEGRHKRKDGSVFSVETNVKYIEHEDKAYMVAVARNLSERQNLVDKIYKQYEFMENIIESLAYPFCVINASDYSVQLANSKYWEEASGKRESRTCYTLSHNHKTPCVGEEHPCPLEFVKKSKQPVVVEHVHNEGGKIRNVEVHGYPVFDDKKNLTQIIEYTIDITERKRTQRELKIRDAIKNIFLMVTDDKIYNAILNVLLEALNSPLGLFGFINEDDALVVPSMVGHVWEKCSLPDKNTWGECAWSMALKQKKTMYSNDNSLKPTGQTPMYRYISVPIVHKDRAIGLMLVANKENDYEDYDIRLMESIADHIAPILQARLENQIFERERDFELEERKKAEEALKNSEWKFKSIVDCSPNGIVIIQNEKIIFANRSVSKITGYKDKEMIGRSFLDLLVGIDKKDPDKFLRSILLTESDVKDKDLHKNIQFLRKDQTKGWLRLRGAEIVLDGKLSYLINLFDITKMKETEMQLLQKEKLVTIGQLAAGVAHEINNPISFIVSNLRMLNEYSKDLKGFYNECAKLIKKLRNNELERDKNGLTKIEWVARLSEFKYAVQEIESLIPESMEGAQKVGQIVKDIKSFARIDSDEFEFANINELLKSTINILWNQIKYDSSLTTDFDESIPEIKCGTRQLSQAFLNVIMNASHAIQKKISSKVKNGYNQGAIEVHTKLLDDPEIDQKYIEIIIKDDGCGIPEAIKGKIFDPFFTNKEEKKGTGLGLSISLDIIQKHRGRIFFESRENKGTSFKILLPIISDE